MFTLNTQTLAPGASVQILDGFVGKFTARLLNGTAEYSFDGVNFFSGGEPWVSSSSNGVQCEVRLPADLWVKNAHAYLTATASVITWY